MNLYAAFYFDRFSYGMEFFLHIFFDCYLLDRNMTMTWVTKFIQYKMNPEPVLSLSSVLLCAGLGRIFYLRLVGRSVFAVFLNHCYCFTFSIYFYSKYSFMCKRRTECEISSYLQPNCLYLLFDAVCFFAALLNYKRKGWQIHDYGDDGIHSPHTTEMNGRSIQGEIGKVSNIAMNAMLSFHKIRNKYSTESLLNEYCESFSLLGALIGFHSVRIAFYA